ncbi:hypothetical protein AAZV13_01G068750 [Glycine max]|uniref:uncharacterized protein n=1 Tax=Glycine max TaxID=3847 RepID=UPI0003DED138|nr:uncharacterized protein LOC102668385 [Glycine max]
MAPPSWVASPPEQFHIQLPCGAASLPLPFGTGHETEHYNPIFSMSFLEHRVTQQPIKGQKCVGEFNLEKWNAHGAAYLLHDRGCAIFNCDEPTELPVMSCGYDRNH